MKITYAHHNHGTAVMLYVTASQPRSSSLSTWQRVEIVQRPVSWRAARRQYKAMRRTLLSRVLSDLKGQR